MTTERNPKSMHRHDLEAEVQRLRALVNTPQVHDFTEAVRLEAVHQRERFDVDHDAGKEPQDWFWLVGYLAGKCLRACIDGHHEKALHHTISTAAVLANWHAFISGSHTSFRPGIEPPDAEPEAHTGISASWCPHCGECTCPRDSSGHWITDPEAVGKAWSRRGRCMLHAPESGHGEGDHEQVDEPCPICGAELYQVGQNFACISCTWVSPQMSNEGR